MEEAARALLDVQPSDDPNVVADTSNEVFGWIEVKCHPDVAQPGVDAPDRRLAPPPGARLEPLVFCSVIPGATLGDDEFGRAVLYGDPGASDPYAGPMLGVVWGTDWDARGDGEPTPVRVRGRDGVAAPITVFQQTILEELGSVVAWEEEGLSVGLYGRLWDQSRIGELVALVEQLEFVDGGFRFPPDAVRPGFAPVYSGAAGALGLVFQVNTTYQVQYQLSESDLGLVTLTGRIATPDEFEAFRFFALDTGRTDLGCRPAIVGNAWGGAGPAVVIWREIDGLVISLVGIGVPLDAVQNLAAQTRELTRSEWTDLVQSKSECSLTE